MRVRCVEEQGGGMMCMGSNEAGMQVFVDNSTKERGWRTAMGPDYGGS